MQQKQEIKQNEKEFEKYLKIEKNKQIDKKGKNKKTRQTKAQGTNSFVTQAAGT